MTRESWTFLENRGPFSFGLQVSSPLQERCQTSMKNASDVHAVTGTHQNVAGYANEQLRNAWCKGAQGLRLGTGRIHPRNSGVQGVQESTSPGDYGSLVCPR
jgi:hypothetical protein